VFSGSSNSSNRSVQSPGIALVASIIGVLVYTLLIGFLLLGERIAPERAYLLIALPCLVPAIWYLSGFLRADGNDTGLVVSSLGWFLVALALFSKHMVFVSIRFPIRLLPGYSLCWLLPDLWVAPSYQVATGCRRPSESRE
jgi:hypothetical protein